MLTGSYCKRKLPPSKKKKKKEKDRCTKKKWNPFDCKDSFQKHAHAAKWNQTLLSRSLHTQLEHS